MKAANLFEANSFSLTKYLTVILVMIQFWTQAQTTFPTLPYTDLQKLNRSLPYVRFYGADSSLLVFGSNHTNQFGDPQIRLIRDLILSFHPTIVLYEGDGIGTEATGKETTETYFEMGFAKFIADSLGIESGNIEPPTHAKFKHLLKRYSVDDVMLATLGLQITMMQVNNDPFEATYPTMTSDLVREGLPITPGQSTLDYFYHLYASRFGKKFSYESFDSRDIQAKYSRTIFNEINQEANRFRDQHIIQLTSNQLRSNKRVLLIEGGWHAIVCEPAFHQITHEPVQEYRNH